MLLLQFVAGVIVTLEEAQDGHEDIWDVPEWNVSRDLLISNYHRDINRLNLSIPLTHSNLSPMECAVLRSLRFNPNLTIKPADKGGAVVVWRTDVYITEAMRQLSDTSSYRPLDHDPTPDCQNFIRQTIHNLIISDEPPLPTASNLIEVPTYVRDTTHALHLLQDFQFPGPQHLIFIMAIQPLYTCIPHVNDLKALCFFLSCRSNQSPSTNTLICLTELVFTLNIFSFNSHFLQTEGLAMGTCMGPNYVCLF
eukprot:g26777.t1